MPRTKACWKEAKPNAEAKRFYSTETKRKFLKVRDKNFASMRQRANDKIKEEGRKSLIVYKQQGREAEFWELIETLLEKGVPRNMKVYDKDGNLIPLLDFEERRPSRSVVKYDKRVLSTIVERIINGDTLSNICLSEGMPPLIRVRDWYSKYPEVARQLDQAYTERADYYVDQLYGLMEEVKNNSLDVKKGTFIADQIKWLAERLHPKFVAKGRDAGINVQVNDEGKVQFQILLHNPASLKKEITDGSENASS